jgi:diguanylate cyclase (GGDEF)-like protein
MLNASAESMTGWTEAEALGKPIETVVNLFQSGLGEDGTESPALNPAYAVLRDNKPLEIPADFLLIGQGGRRIAVQLSASPLVDPQGRLDGAILALHDTSEAMQLAQRMAYQAQHDPLTGLPNRILLADRLDQATKLADRLNEQLAVVFLDLDDFHEINDAYGRTVGDALLREVAYRLTDSLRESDTVCRLGADEFVILLSGVKSTAAVEALVAKLFAEIRRPYPLGENTIQVACTLGVSLYPQDANDASTLMRLADGALHQAKAAGRDRRLFARPDAAKTLVE